MEKREMNNKGFSLVELIIVIAIMAVLVGILAPQFLKYVERSRNSADQQTATEIGTALLTYAADPDSSATHVDPVAGTITIGDTPDYTVTDGTDGSFAHYAYSALTDAGIKGTIKCSSKTTWTQYTVHFEDAGNGAWRVTYSAQDSEGNNKSSEFMANATSSGT